MSEIARAHQTQQAQQTETTWPHDVSHRPTMTISAAVALLKAEFPSITVSKLRFLEDQGIVAPSRTGSGYRKYSLADIERLRYALSQQRDDYRPLSVIREQLDDLDAGRSTVTVRSARVVAKDGLLVSNTRGAKIDARELAELTGVSIAEIQQIVEAGVITPDSRGRFPARAVSVVQLLTTLGARGIAPRNLRSLALNAQGTAGLVSQVVAPGRASHGVARERSDAEAAEIADVASRLYAELVRVAVEDS